jgi:hypothetical protein
MMKKVKWFGMSMLLALTIGFASSAAAVTAEQIEECANDPEKLVALVDGLSTAQKAAVVASVLEAIAATSGTADAKFARVLDIAMNDLGVSSTVMASALGGALANSAISSQVSAQLSNQSAALASSFSSGIATAQAGAGGAGNLPPVDVAQQPEQQQTQQQVTIAQRPPVAVGYAGQQLQ